jgi:hypothetical protein
MKEKKILSEKDRGEKERKTRMMGKVTKKEAYCTRIV